VTPIPQNKLWRHLRGRCGATSKPRNTCTGWRPGWAAVGVSPLRTPWRTRPRAVDRTGAGGNLLRWVFVAPAARGFHIHWGVATDIAVSELCEVAGTDLGDPRLRAMIDELMGHSLRFRELWA
jgi:hypothetical protein